jgi:tRNA 2-thiouridine synthesizing protein E
MGQKKEESVEFIDVVKFDKYGFLDDFKEWDKSCGIFIAKKERIDKLTKKNWQAIYFVRGFYEKYGRTPTSMEIARAVGIKMKDYIDNFPFRTDALVKIAGLPWTETRAC